MPAQASTPSPTTQPDPGSRASFELFEEQYFLSGSWSELTDLYRQRIADASLADDAAERARLMVRLGRVLEERVGDEDGAIAVYRECATLAPDRRPPLKRLRRLYKRRQSWATVLQVAELEIEATRDPTERALLHQEMSDIWEQELGDPEQAEQLRARARDEAGSAQNPESQQGGGQPASVERARALAEQGRTEQAVAVLRERLEVESADVAALDLLLSILETSGRHAELPKLLERRASHATDAPTLAAILVRLGQLHETLLDDPDAARAAYERAMGADPASREAGAALARCYQAHESWDALRMLLEARIAHAPADLQAGLLCELADLHADRLDDPEAAAAAWQRALAIDPRNEPARAALEKRNTRTGEPGVDNALAERLAALEADGAGTSPNAVRLRLRLAERASTYGDDAARAIEVLEPCLSDPAALPEVARSLRRLYEQAGRHESLVALTWQVAGASEDPNEVIEWCGSGATAARAAGDTATVVSLLEHVLEVRPGDRQTENALLELHRSAGAPRPLLAMLRRVLHRVAPLEEAPLHAEAARLLEDSLADPDAAFVHWRRALALDPSDVEVLTRALRCAEATGGALRQLDLLELAAAAATLPRDRAQLLARRGELLTDALKWTEEGAESWRLSLELDPDQPAVRSRLEASAAA
jgi:tetratricopeptide (TPR) repeat protein